MNTPSSFAVCCWLMGLAGGITGPSVAAAPNEVRIYAAASLREVLEELAPALERATGAEVVFNFAGSSTLARQIVAAGKADVFFSADQAWMDAVDDAGLVARGSRRSLLSNRLVVVAPAASKVEVQSPRDLAAPAIRRLALAQPEVVPAGKYAKAWLRSLGLWESLESRVVPTLDVRAALAAVETGSVDLGVVYQTDAALSRRVRVVYEVPADAGIDIAYALAALVGGNQARALLVVEWLTSAEASDVFERYGFLRVPRPLER